MAAKTKKDKKEEPEVIETKALLITKGEGQNFEIIEKEDLVKETFSESDYEKSSTTLNLGDEFFGKEVTSDTIKIGDQDVHAIAFEDGSVYQVGYGFRSLTEDQDTKSYFEELHASLSKEAAKGEK